jgi:alpha-1,3-mannosyltransferase
MLNRILLVSIACCALALLFGIVPYSPYDDDLQYHISRAKVVSPIHHSHHLYNLFTSHKFFIAVNLRDAQPVLVNLLTQIVKFVHFVGKDRVYISIFENGSKDRTSLLLKEFKSILESLGIPNTVISMEEPDLADPDRVKWHGWREMFVEYLEQRTGMKFDGFNDALAKIRSKRPIAHLEREMPRIRVQYMAELRNAVIKPLFTSTGWKDDDDSVLVLFLNDVIFSYKDLIELIGTGADDSAEVGEISYDGVCSLDFSGLKLYDTWVIRDMHGRMLSSFYPFFRDLPSRLQIREKRPVRVFSCWNGLAVLNGQVFTKVRCSHLII